MKIELTEEDFSIVLAAIRAMAESETSPYLQDLQDRILAQRPNHDLSSGPPRVAVAAYGAAPTGAAPTVNTLSVYIVSFQLSRLPAIKALRTIPEFSDLSLKELASLPLPILVASEIDSREALRLADLFRSLGATMEVLP